MLSLYTFLIQHTLVQWLPTGEEFLPREEFYFHRGRNFHILDFKRFQFCCTLVHIRVSELTMHFIKLV